MHDPIEALVTAWNEGAAVALDQIVFMQPLFSHGSCCSVQFMEELRKMGDV